MDILQLLTKEYNELGEESDTCVRSCVRMLQHSTADHWPSARTSALLQGGGGRDSRIWSYDHVLYSSGDPIKNLEWDSFSLETEYDSLHGLINSI